MGMRATALALLPALALAACAGMGGPRDRYDYLLRQPVANPSEVVAAELAFARAAQEDGQWTAFREYSTDDAVMFVPEQVNAHQWLDGRADPPQSVAWQPHEVWSSCDGSLAVTRGAAQWPNGANGDFLTVWQRQGNGDYRWVADMGQLRQAALPEPDFVRTKVAACTPAVPVDRRTASSENLTAVTGQSRDGTMQYRILQPEGGRVFKLMLWNGAAFDEAFTAVFENQ